MIKVCDQIATKLGQYLGKYKIRISSSEVIDGIFEEARIPLEKRHKVLTLLGGLDLANWSTLKKELVEKNLVPASCIERMGDLLRIRGSVDDLTKDI